MGLLRSAARSVCLLEKWRESLYWGDGKVGEKDFRSINSALFVDTVFLAFSTFLLGTYGWIMMNSLRTGTGTPAVEGSQAVGCVRKAAHWARHSCLDLAWCHWLRLQRAQIDRLIDMLDNRYLNIEDGLSFLRKPQCEDGRGESFGSISSFIIRLRCLCVALPVAPCHGLDTIWRTGRVGRSTLGDPPKCGKQKTIWKQISQNNSIHLTSPTAVGCLLVWKSGRGTYEHSWVKNLLDDMDDQAIVSLNVFQNRLFTRDTKST